MKKWFAILLAVLLVCPLVYAKGGGGGGSSGGRSGGSSSFGGSKSFSSTTSSKSSPATTPSRVTPAAPPSSGGYSRTPLAPAAKTAGPSSGGYSRAAVPSAPITLKSASSFDSKTVKTAQVDRSQKSLAEYKAEQAKFKAPPVPAPANKTSGVYGSATTYGRFDHGSYRDRRDSFYRTSSYTAPTYVYNTAPSFGMWDGMFWWWVMSNSSHNASAASMAHNYQADPGYLAWKREAEKLSTDNAELKAKLEAHNKVVLAQTGKPDPSFMPKDIPANVMLSAETIQSKEAVKPELIVATGMPTGVYQKFGKALVDKTEGIQVKLTGTGGTMQNIRLFESGKVQAAIVQADVLAGADLKKKTEQTKLYEENLFLITNVNSNISELNDLIGGKVIMLTGERDSGTSETWKYLCGKIPRLQQIPADNLAQVTALDRVADNKHYCMLVVVGNGSGLMWRAEQTAKSKRTLRLASVQIKEALNLKDPNGTALYRTATISSTLYPSMAASGWLGSRDTQTISLAAVLVLDAAWSEKFGPVVAEQLALGFLTAKETVR
jgi:TRAP-type uncharacterized transport system substrate-binding protein